MSIYPKSAAAVLPSPGRNWAYSTVLNHVCLGLPILSPVFGRTPNAGPKSSRMVLTDDFTALQ